MADWSPTWEAARAAIPAETALGDPPDGTTCSHALGRLHELQSDLFPTPDLALDGPVEEWLRIAEDALFECPPDNSQVESIAAAYREMALIEEEVASVLQGGIGDG